MRSCSSRKNARGARESSDGIVAGSPGNAHDGDGRLVNASTSCARDASRARAAANCSLRTSSATPGIEAASRASPSCLPSRIAATTPFARGNRRAAACARRMRWASSSGPMPSGCRVSTSAASSQCARASRGRSLRAIARSRSEPSVFACSARSHASRSPRSSASRAGSSSSCSRRDASSSSASATVAADGRACGDACMHASTSSRSSSCCASSDARFGEGCVPVSRKHNVAPRP